jgi:hypothetical protein
VIPDIRCRGPQPVPDCISGQQESRSRRDATRANIGKPVRQPPQEEGAHTSVSGALQQRVLADNKNHSYFASPQTSRRQSPRAGPGVFLRPFQGLHVLERYHRGSTHARPCVAEMSLIACAFSAFTSRSASAKNALAPRINSWKWRSPYSVVAWRGEAAPEVRSLPHRSQTVSASKPATACREGVHCNETCSHIMLLVAPVQPSQPAIRAHARVSQPIQV